VTYVVAAGNNKANLAGFVPAAYDEVLAVTAITDFNGQPGGGGAATCRTGVDDTPADFSNFTTTDNALDVAHTIAAPGVCITSTWKGGGYKTISGTSMASPHVAGAVATCIASKLCAGEASAIIEQIREDAKDQRSTTPSYGFVGDPSNPLTSGKGASQKTLYYGHLVFAGGY
jgi:subtilisin family serine protease